MIDEMDFPFAIDVQALRFAEIMQENGEFHQDA